MSGYTQLTREARYQIYAFLKAGFTQTAIADQIGVHKATICRELSRNKGQRGYRPKQAHQAAVNRKREAPRFAKMNPELIAIIEHLIGTEWSPAQIAGVLNKNSETSVISHETIYQYIYKDKAYGGQLYKHLSNSKR